MQGLADGYFVLPNTINDYLADGPFEKVADDHPAVGRGRRRRCAARIDQLLADQRRPHASTPSTASSANSCGSTAAWPAPTTGLRKALDRIPRAARGVLAPASRCPGTGEELNQSLEKAGRVADFLELGRADVPRRAAPRASPAAATSARSPRPPTARRPRDDEDFAYVAAWEFTGTGRAPVLHKEALAFEYVHPTQRSYA